MHEPPNARYLKTDDLGNLTMATEEAVDDIMRGRERAAPIGWSANPGWRAVALSVGYVALYLTLDRLSFVGALHGVGITPWSPSTGLAMALLVINRLRKKSAFWKNGHETGSQWEFRSN